MLKNKSFRALNILKFVSSTDWGADSTVLLNLYRSKRRHKNLVSETILIGELYNFNSGSGWSPLLLQKCIPRGFELDNLNPFSTLIDNVQYQVGIYSPSSRTTTLTWSVQNVSS
jgi:hypothetical protein